MSRMIVYGFWKSWRTRRLFLLICVGGSALLLPAARLMLGLHWEAAAAVCFPVLFVLSMMLMVGPFVWGITDYVRGVSGSHSVLERAVAVPAWQKLLARLIVSVAVIVVLALAGVAVLAGAAAVVVDSYPTVREMWNQFAADAGSIPIAGYLFRSGVWGFVGGVFQVAKLLLLIYFVVALAKSFPGNRKLGVIVIIAACVAYSILSSMAAQLLAQVPICTFTLSVPPQELQSIVQMDGSITGFSAMTVSLSGILANAALAVLAFFGTAWLMEYRVES